MVNYQNGKIYKIVNDVNGMIYVGSTVKLLCNRMSHHRTTARENNNSKFYQYMRELGIEKFKIALIESYPCSSKEELHAKEDEYIRILKPELNTVNAIENTEKKTETKRRNRKAYYDTHKELEKEQRKVWDANNKDKISEQKKRYQIKHKDEIKQQKHNHYEENKDIINQKNKEYRIAHKEEEKQRTKERRKIKEQCGCGSTYSKCRQSEHLKTKQHIEWATKQNNIKIT
jgi:hypothetical protein